MTQVLPIMPPMQAGRSPALGGVSHRTEMLAAALELGVLAIENGGSTTMADDAFRSVLHASAIDDGFAVWRIDFAAAGFARDGTTSIIKAVGRIGENFRRVSEISKLTERARRKAVGAGALAEEIDRIRHLDSPYGPWTMTAATACTAGLFVRLQGADWWSFALAFLAVVVGQVFRYRLKRLDTSVAATTLACATVSAMVAAAGIRFRTEQFAPATIVAAIIYLVPGLPLVNGFADLASHSHLIMGVQRVASAALQCVLLAIGVTIAVMIVW